jgi:hypothetical protein
MFLDNFDWFGFSLNDVKWFEDCGCRLIKVDAAPGNLHYSSLPKSETIKTIICATYTPARLATPEYLALKSELFHKYEATTHWPHCNIFPSGWGDAEWKALPAGERQAAGEVSIDRERLLKLAGVKPY